MSIYSFREVGYRDILFVRELDIPENKSIVILGPSGSGKSTFLRLLNHLISPDRGELSYRGRPIGETDPVALRRRVVMLPQAPVIFPGSVKDNLLAGLVFAGRDLVGDARLREALDELQLSQGLSQDAALLSGGEKQRLALGRVLLMEPEALLLDEPSSALDSETEQLIADLIAGRRRDRKANVIMVTHSEKLSSGADIVWRVRGGRFEQDRRQ